MCIRDRFFPRYRSLPTDHRCGKNGNGQRWFQTGKPQLLLPAGGWVPSSQFHSRSIGLSDQLMAFTSRYSMIYIFCFVVFISRSFVIISKTNIQSTDIAPFPWWNEIYMKAARSFLRAAAGCVMRRFHLHFYWFRRILWYRHPARFLLPHPDSSFPL